MTRPLLLPLTILPLLVACDRNEVPAPPAPPAPQSAAPAPEAAPPAATPASPVAAGANLARGENVYKRSCLACHGAGVAGAPRVGDKAAWAPRIAQGADTLYLHSIKGFQGRAGMMPARGGNPALSDEDVRAAVDYMVAKSK